LSAVDGCGGRGRVAVGTGDVFVLGDHRGASSDSRSFGPVPASNVLGKVVGVVWPLGRIGAV
jgi:signal peptidase I